MKEGKVGMDKSRNQNQNEKGVNKTLMGGVGGDHTINHTVVR